MSENRNGRRWRMMAMVAAIAVLVGVALGQAWNHAAAGVTHNAVAGSRG